jgi:hypothetical protein
VSDALDFSRIITGWLTVGLPSLAGELMAEDQGQWGSETHRQHRASWPCGFLHNVLDAAEIGDITLWFFWKFQLRIWNFLQAVFWVKCLNPSFGSLDDTA